MHTPNKLLLKETDKTFTHITILLQYKPTSPIGIKSLYSALQVKDRAAPKHNLFPNVYQYKIPVYNPMPTPTD